MRDYFIKSLFIIIISFSIIPSNAYSWPNGISQRTKKSNNLGCGNCHYFGAINTAVFSGPDTVYKGQSVQYCYTISKSSSGKLGVDIAARNGLLDTAGCGQYLKILNSELVHSKPIPFSNTLTIYFLYVAPNYIGTDTLYSTFNVGYTGAWRWSANKVVYIKQPIGISNISEPAEYELFQNYPNPFNPYTIISYSLKYNTFVNLDVYDIKGKLIANLVNGFQKTGKYTVPFSIYNHPLSSGVYYYRLMTDRTSEVKSMMLIK